MLKDVTSDASVRPVEPVYTQASVAVLAPPAGTPGHAARLQGPETSGELLVSPVASPSGPRAVGQAVEPEADGVATERPCGGVLGDQNPLFLIHEHKAWVEGGLEERLGRYLKAKRHSVYVANWRKENPQGGDKGGLLRAGQQLGCGGFLHFRKAITGDDTAWKLHNAIFCQQSHTCWLCALRKGARTVQAIMPRLAEVLRKNPHLRLKFVTLTLQNACSLSATFNVLDGGLKTLVRQCRDAKRNPRNSRAMRAVVGGVGHIETKRGKGGQWHPHYHGVWLVDPAKAETGSHALSYADLGQAWEAATGGLGRWIKVVDLFAEKFRELGTESGQFQEQLFKDICEVIKYAVKFESEQLAGDYWTAADVLRGKTLVRSFGVMHGVKVPEDLRDEPLSWDELEFIERYFKYTAGEYRERPVPGVVQRHSEFDQFNQPSEVPPCQTSPVVEPLPSVEWSWES